MFENTPKGRNLHSFGLSLSAAMIARWTVAVEHGALRRVAPRAAAQGVWPTVVRRMFRPHLRGRGRRSAPSSTRPVEIFHTFLHKDAMTISQ